MSIEKFSIYVIVGDVLVTEQIEVGEFSHHIVWKIPNLLYCATKEVGKFPQTKLRNSPQCCATKKKLKFFYKTNLRNSPQH